jgi:cytochrome-b5 reductase
MLPNLGAKKELTMREIGLHNTPSDAWIVIHGGVYDVSDFASKHPGGAGLLLRAAGRDVSDEFDDVFHSSRAKGKLEPLKIGTVRGYKGEARSSSAESTRKENTGSREAEGRGAPTTSTAPRRTFQTRDQQSSKETRGGSSGYGSSSRSGSQANQAQSNGDGPRESRGQSSSTNQQASRGGQSYQSHGSSREAQGYSQGGDRAPAKVSSGSRRGADESNPYANGNDTHDGDAPIARSFHANVMAVHTYTPDTFILCLQCENMPEMGPGQHVRIAIETDDGMEVRSYSPIRYDNAASLLWFLIKEYEYGIVSRALGASEEGDQLRVSGPFECFSMSSLLRNNRDSRSLCKYDRLLFINAGTGITPMFSMITNFICDGIDSKRRNFINTDVRVVTANKTPSDVLLHQELAKFSQVIDVLHTVSAVGNGDPDKWPTVGRLTLADVEFFIEGSHQPFAIVCGPPKFIEMVDEYLDHFNVENFLFPSA